MHINTLKAIDLWLKMYTAEELKSLEIACGETTITFEDQLLARYENLVPRGSIFNFKANCAKIIVANRLWVFKIQQMNSKSYETWMKAIKPEHFKQRTHTKFGYAKDQETSKTTLDHFEKISKDFLKTRSGDSEIAEEYDLESQWLDEDLKILRTGRLDELPTLSKTETPTPDPENPEEKYEDTFFAEEKSKKRRTLGITVNRGRPTSQEGASPADQYFLTPVDNTDTRVHGDNYNEKPVLKNINLSSTLKGFRTEHNSDKSTIAESISDTDGYRTADTFKLGDIILDFQRFDPIDVMERYLQKFDCLFTKECQ